MRSTTITCDGPNCAASKLLEPLDAADKRGWITVQRERAREGDRLALGTLHFCGEACLVRKVLAGSELEKVLKETRDLLDFHNLDRMNKAFKDTAFRVRNLLSKILQTLRP